MKATANLLRRFWIKAYKTVWLNKKNESLEGFQFSRSPNLSYKTVWLNKKNERTVITWLTNGLVNLQMVWLNKKNESKR